MKVRIDKRKLESLIKELPGDLDSFMRSVAEDGVSDMKLSMGTSPPGESYRRGGVVHVASQPGYPPNVDTGTLRASLRWEKKGDSHYWLMDGVVYGAHLEFGTSKMQARPFMRPVMEDISRKFGGTFIKAKVIK